MKHDFCHLDTAMEAKGQEVWFHLLRLHWLQNVLFDEWVWSSLVSWQPGTHTCRWCVSWMSGSGCSERELLFSQSVGGTEIMTHQLVTTLAAVGHIHIIYIPQMASLYHNYYILATIIKQHSSGPLSHRNTLVPAYVAQ